MKKHLNFHPALIQLQEASPRPLGRWVLWILIGLVLFLLIWSVIGRLDIVAVADGKLVPASYLKIIQPSDAGTVKRILVHEGESVRAGQVVMELDPLLANADLQAMTMEYENKRLQMLRIDAELSGVPFTAQSASPLELVTQAEQQYAANRKALTSALAEEQSRLEKAQQELAVAQQQKVKLMAILPHYREQEKAYDKLVSEGFAGSLMAGDKKRERIEKEQELAAQIHIIASAQASMEQSARKKQQIESEYKKQLLVERNEAAINFDKLSQELKKQKHRLGLMELRAPQDGIIKNLATHTIGTVVQPGTILATLVPSGDRLKAEVWLSNEDIGFVRVGQQVKLKFATYSFQKYGMGTGVVEYVSADALSEEEARERGFSAPGQMLRYKVLVTLGSTELLANGVKNKLSVGMQTSAEILLGQRTIAEYLLSPVQKAWHESARER